MQPAWTAIGCQRWEALLVHRNAHGRWWGQATQVCRILLLFSSTGQVATFPFFFLPQQVYDTYCLFYGSIDWGCTCLPSTRRRARGILHSNLTAKHLFISLATQARLKIQDFFGVHRPRICSTTVRVLDLSARGCLILALTSLSLKNIGPAAWSKQSETMISDRQCSVNIYDGFGRRFFCSLCPMLELETVFYEKTGIEVVFWVVGHRWCWAMPQLFPTVSLMICHL